MFKMVDEHYQNISRKLTSLEQKLSLIEAVEISGKITKAIGTMVTANLLNVKIGDMCLIRDEISQLELFAEVIALDGHDVKLLPFGTIDKISKKAMVSKFLDNFKIKIGDFLLGSIIDGLGNLLQYLPGAEAADSSCTDFNYVPISANAPDPLTRPVITEQFFTGVKAIDLFTSCGQGQRLAIFASAGMGKTTLMGMILRNSQADVIVVSLIGERGREVQEFIELEINEVIRKKCILVVATSDRPPVEQAKSAYVAQTIAEYFREQGKTVLLFMDSLTRFARALREVGISAGEQPARGGYPPSVFSAFPRLMERAGSNIKGSITAFYTVLLETEDVKNDPIADEIKSIGDGHIYLSRALAEQGHFPAINILSSLSRIADRIIGKKHSVAARKIRLLLSKHAELEFLIRVGEYKEGNDKLADEAINKYPAIMQMLSQGIHELIPFKDSLNKLVQLAEAGGG